MRSLLAVGAAAAVAALGAAILGEYELVGATPLVGGPLFGLLMAEVVVVVAGDRSWALAALAAVATVVGLVWAAWISSGRDWSFVPGEAWVGVALGSTAALAWVRGSKRRAAGSPESP